ncbi:phosphate regulon transcriptional regulatory protein PhoB [Lachnospiraceae bacterium KM106-2]|nr:phosphate regulon transcriptional regulatory protein PhoB [Lachnospiraceae bacterium KM106-2]
MLIYVVEDDENIREIETYALKNAGFEVKSFESGEAFWQEIELLVPDLVILDIMLPQEDGMSILASLRKKTVTKQLPIMMITAKSMEIDKVKGLDAGADDYMTKPFGIMELVSRVKALLRRTAKPESNSVLSIGDLVLDKEKHQVSVHDQLVELTYKEYELLKLLMKNKNIVLSRDKIMERVWGFDYEGESRTVDMHIKTLRQKLGDQGSMIKTVRNVGYKIGDQT